ncbi:DnaD domain protein [Acholeplasma sp. OttesenSCG-928-E16]|nr:DnaD domain protein [Acholeplasma sp. OttesenSCG-928-E16]
MTRKLTLKQSLQLIDPATLINNFCRNNDATIADEIESFYKKNNNVNKAILNVLLLTALKRKNYEYQGTHYLSKILNDWKQREINTVKKAITVFKKTIPEAGTKEPEWFKSFYDGLSEKGW